MKNRLTCCIRCKRDVNLNFILIFHFASEFYTCSRVSIYIFFFSKFHFFKESNLSYCDRWNAKIA